MISSWRPFTRYERCERGAGGQDLRFEIAEEGRGTQAAGSDLRFEIAEKERGTQAVGSDLRFEITEEEMG